LKTKPGNWPNSYDYSLNQGSIEGGWSDIIRPAFPDYRLLPLLDDLP